MDASFRSFLGQFNSYLSFSSNGQLASSATLEKTPSLDRVIASLPAEVRSRMPSLDREGKIHKHFAEWVRSLPEQDRIACNLNKERPPKHIHYVFGGFGLFYDFRNTDIILEDFERKGLAFSGRVLDFGCSSGRNVATLERAFGDELELFGVDPVQSSIDWASGATPSACFKVNRQEPPLDFPDNHFDVVVAKSIWTHFSEAAAKAWFTEIARVLKPGGRFFFSTHGPQDVAYRLIYNFPNPNYANYTGPQDWTRETFLQAVIDGLRDKGFFFRSFKRAGIQADLGKIRGSDTAHWGLTFMTPEFLQTSLLPNSLNVVSHRVGRTGNRHDSYIVVKESG